MRPDLLLGGLVALLLIAMSAGMMLAHRKRSRQPVVVVPRTQAPAELLDAIARLDARYQGGEAGTPALEWDRYQAERARLKSELERALASRGGVP